MGQGDVLELLEKTQEGLTAKEMSEALGVRYSTANASILTLRKYKDPPIIAIGVKYTNESLHPAVVWGLASWKDNK